MSGVVPATVAGKWIGAESSATSTKPNCMLEAAKDGEVRIAEENVKQKFVVVDFPR
jgi:hypothetical protein